MNIREESMVAGEVTITRQLEAALSRPFPDDGVQFENIVQTIEKELVRKAMREARENQSKAARLLIGGSPAIALQPRSVVIVFWSGYCSITWVRTSAAHLSGMSGIALL